MSLRLVLTLACLLGGSAHGAQRDAFARSHVAGAPASAARVLLVDIDDVGFDLLRETNTPTLDWIEANGRFFTSFTTSPLCSPTRAMVNTGAYPSHPDLLVGGLVRDNSDDAMPLGPLRTLASIVTDEGYTTAKVGKWHLATSDLPEHVRQAGWQSYAGVIANLGSQSTFRRFDKTINGVTSQVIGRYLTTDETDDGIRCVRAGIDLVSVSYHAPHKPYHAPPGHLHSETDLSTERAQARAMLEACDTELARLLGAALARGYVVIVFADNGTSHAIGGDKGRVRDGGVVVPMWAVGPGVVPGVEPTPLGAQDLYATVAELLGVDTSAPDRGPHSRSFVRALRGNAAYRRWSYVDRFATIGADPRASGEAWLRMVRGTRFKLIRDTTSAREILIDLENDPDESVDLLDSLPLAPDAAAALAVFHGVLERI